MKSIPAKKLLIPTKSDLWFGVNYTVNLYRGCNHGCIYCDSRSACYQNDNFDEVAYKNQALDILKNDLFFCQKSGVIGTGSMSDPYNILEEKLELTRKALQLINAFHFGVSIATKSKLVLRDIDLLKKIHGNAPVIVKITITTCNESLAKKIEPNACTVEERFQTIKVLSEAGIFCGVLLMPILPFITDQEENIKNIILRAKNAGAKFVYPLFGVTLRDRQRDYYYKQLEIHFPNLKEKYEKQFHNSYSCFAINSTSLQKKFYQTCLEEDILCHMDKIIQAYKDASHLKKLTIFDFDAF